MEWCKEGQHYAEETIDLERRFENITVICAECIITEMILCDPLDPTLMDAFTDNEETEESAFIEKERELLDEEMLIENGEEQMAIDKSRLRFLTQHFQATPNSTEYSPIEHAIKYTFRAMMRCAEETDKEYNRAEVRRNIIEAVFSPNLPTSIRNFSIEGHLLQALRGLVKYEE